MRPDAPETVQPEDRENVADRVARAEAALAAAQQEYAAATAAAASEWNSEPGVTMSVTADGVRAWRNQEGQLHRVNGPAIETPSGTQEWYQNGEFHREDGPARVLPGVGEEWYQHGQPHRDDGPAFDYSQSTGDQEWYRHGVRHRVDGPAYMYDDGGYEYFVNGRLHRVDGPASVWQEGDTLHEDWFVNGKPVEPLSDDPTVRAAADKSVWNVNQPDKAPLTNYLKDQYRAEINDKDWDTLVEYAREQGYPISNKPITRDEWATAVSRDVHTLARNGAEDSFDVSSALAEIQPAGQKAVNSVTVRMNETTLSVLQALTASTRNNGPSLQQIIRHR